MYDITIIGAGLAGLSLAIRLTEPKFAGLRILVLDPRQQLQRKEEEQGKPGNKTWCAWRRNVHPFATCVEHRWSTGLLSDTRQPVNGVVQLDFSTCPYERITEARLVEFSIGKLAATQHITLSLAVMVTDVTESGGYATITSSMGNILSKLVFDSRPPTPSARAWRQVFRGGEYTLLRNRNSYRSSGNDIDTSFTMMAMTPAPRGEGCRFMYELPLSQDRSLLQATAFIPPGAPTPADAVWQSMLEEYIAKRGDTVVRLDQAEDGEIVMDPNVPALSELTTITAIGARGGFVRAATGYSFSRAQRACDALVTAIETWQRATIPAQALPIPIKWQSSLIGLLDRVFFEALSREDVDTAALFWQLARGTSGDRLARFLDGEPTFRDLAVVIRSMPMLAFAKSSLHVAQHRARG